MRFVGLILSFALLCTIATTSTAEADDDSAWRALAAPGTVAVMRHALAPGFSDPEKFDVNDCTTQRNLNDAGRDQALAPGRLCLHAWRLRLVHPQAGRLLEVSASVPDRFMELLAAGE